ncbi:cupin domain-containing protein [Nonomuraea phyllanthi]|uniref:Cupin domain-containing protein n=1 Tax=Nonomuraea phyllanthi TaxID=2219224 RepID=A0A5C4VMY8_9ACTN|nr:cupin domain-containing protein [Nonomuraea phyllanthi]KAB8189431.1 cupin domain-containing protein [Nonomuraea phyllanthi]
MTRIRTAGALLAGTVLALATGCSSADQDASATIRAAATTISAPNPDRPAEAFKPLFQQALPNVEGKTFTSAIVDFPADAKALPHRHGDAFVYAHVLEGSVRSQVAGSPARTYHKGENWVEQPGAHHILTENASATEEAKLLVVFISDTGDELKSDDHHS